MDKLFSEGQFPPRWSGELNNGYGYPVFLFNYPLPALAGEIFHKAGLNFLYSVKAVLISSMVLSVLGMYLFLRSYLGTNLAAFLGAAFYLYAPHRFLNVYVSAAAGGALGDALVPFVFWSMVEISKSQGWVLAGAVFFALLVLAHNITTLIFAPLILGFAGLLIWETKDRFKVFWSLGIMFLLGLSLSAWFWLPAIVEKQYIRFDEVFNTFYQSQFVSIQQMIRSPWGFGLSHPQNPEEGDLSYQIGLIHILAMVFLTGAMVIFKKIRQIGLFILSFFIFSLLLIHKISQPVWDFIPVMKMIQFPLRFSAISIFTASIGVALLIKHLPQKKIIFACFLALVIYANRNHWRINQVFDPGEDYYLALKTTTASFDEHLPKWGRKMVKGAPEKLELIRGIGEIKVVRDQSAKVEAEAIASGSAKLRLNQFYFPGWEIEVDGKPVEFNYLVEGESYGLPTFDIERGRHRILAEFKNTPIRNLADFISIITVIIIIIVIINPCRLLIRSLLKVKRFF